MASATRPASGAANRRRPAGRDGGDDLAAASRDTPRAHAGRSTSSWMSTQKCAPCPARSTFGDHANAQCFDSSTCATPAAAAERSIEPTLPGSCTSSSSRQKSAPARGRRPRRRDDGQHADARPAATRSRRRATPGRRACARAWRSASVAHGGRASASSVTISVSGAPWRCDVDRDDVLAFEHALARLAPVARRRDERARLRAGADCAAR